MAWRPRSRVSLLPINNIAAFDDARRGLPVKPTCEDRNLWKANSVQKRQNMTGKESVREHNPGIACAARLSASSPTGTTAGFLPEKKGQANQNHTAVDAGIPIEKSRVGEMMETPLQRQRCAL
jgi:hypothetical protein